MMSEALAPRSTKSSGSCIISLKRWFITASRPSARNMHSPCGMLLSAVSNWPASAASRKLEVSALTKIACRLRLMPFRPKKNSTSSTARPT